MEKDMNENQNDEEVIRKKMTKKKFCGGKPRNRSRQI